MNKKRRRRLILILIITVGVSLTVALALYGLKQNINLFYSPSQVNAGSAPTKHLFRVGGEVVPGSIQHYPHSLTIRFVITDRAQQLPILYQGTLPDLFREGQAIVAEGRLNPAHQFVATTILAKHDATYMPPEVAWAIKHNGHSDAARTR